MVNMEKTKRDPKKKYVGIVTVSDKGQIVIPATIRNMFGIQPGDQLVVLANPQTGIVVVKAEESFLSKNFDTSDKGGTK